MEKDLIIQIMYALERRKKGLRDQARGQERNLSEGEKLVIETLDSIAFDLLEFFVERS